MKLDHQLYISSHAYEKHTQFWRKQWEKLPADYRFRQTWASCEGKGDTGAGFELKLGKQAEAAMDKLTKGSDTGTFVLLLTGIALLMRKFSGAPVVRVDSPLLKSNDQKKGLAVTVPLVMEVDASRQLKDFIGQVKQIVEESYSLQNFPIDSAAGRDNPFRTNVLVCYSGLHARPRNMAGYDLVIRLRRKDGVYVGLTGGSGFSQPFLALFARYLSAVLAALTDTSVVMDRIALTGFRADAGRFGGTPPVPGRLIQHLFEEQVRNHPHQDVVRVDTRRISYLALHKSSNRLAHALINDYQLQPGQVVGVLTEQTDLWVTSLLAVLKAGGVYLPIDPAYPAERIAQMVQETQARVLLIHSNHMAALTALYDVPMFALDIQLAGLDSPDTPPDVATRPGAPAYIVFTSGSTGKPKGVVVGHAGLVNMVESQIATFEAGPGDNVLQFASPAFDVSVFEAFLALASGATLVPVTKATMSNPYTYLDFLREQRISIAGIPPAYLKVLDINRLEGLRVVYTGGEAVEPKVVSQLVEKGVTFINQYGLTETTCNSLVYQIRTAPGQHDRIPIGKPIVNTTVRLLDAALNPVPPGIVGELCVGGVGLALSYLNNPALTAERFITTPHAPGEVLYRTGDLAVEMPDGNFEFCGRSDDQVKIRSFRVEPAEIERLLESYGTITQAKVLVKTVGEMQHLAAYLVAGEQEKPADVQAFLRERLPAYMLPDFYAFVPAMPLTLNGKVDKQALLQLAVESPGAVSWESYAPAATEMERRLVRIWEEVLERSPIGIRDHFFEIGGHSLKVTQVVSRLHKELNARVDVRVLFTHPTIEELAKVIEGAEALPYASIPVAPRQEYYPVTNAQKRLWILDQISESKSLYNIPATFMFEGDVDREVLDRAFAALIERHESLRTSFKVVNGELMQQVHPYESVQFAVDYLDMRGGAESQARAAALADQAANAAFDLQTCPLFGVKLIHTGADRYLFQITMHHIISDGWSMEVLAEEIRRLYQAFVAGAPNPLPPLTIQYKDYAHWYNQLLSSDRGAAYRQYWHTRLTPPVQPLEVLTDRPRRAARTYRGSIQSARLSPEVTAQLMQLGRTQGATMFICLLTIVKILLHKYSGASYITVGSPVSCRETPELEKQVGFFLNNLVLRNQILGGESFLALLEKVKNSTLEAFAYQMYPYDQLVEELKPPTPLSRNPFYDVLVVLDTKGAVRTDDSDSAQPFANGITLVPVSTPHTISKLDLSFFFRLAGTQIAVDLEYNTDLYDRSTVEKLIGQLQTLAEGLLKEPTRSIQFIAIAPLHEAALAEKNTFERVATGMVREEF